MTQPGHRGPTVEKWHIRTPDDFFRWWVHGAWVTPTFRAWTAGEWWRTEEAARAAAAEMTEYYGAPFEAYRDDLKG